MRVIKRNTTAPSINGGTLRANKTCSSPSTTTLNSTSQAAASKVTPLGTTFTTLGRSSGSPIIHQS
ncbi:MAG TPA: hypothetical protein DDW21_00405 [Verrucomicrobiales bacterium]|nr:hypothetical protein [Verrucomicrobiales bacterium]